MSKVLYVNPRVHRLRHGELNPRAANSGKKPQRKRAEQFDSP
ncbi:hypothetical protein [Kibdelosporangium philippinense]